MYIKTATDVGCSRPPHRSRPGFLARAVIHLHFERGLRPLKHGFTLVPVVTSQSPIMGIYESCYSSYGIAIDDPV
jgi:hypothetical protein